MFPGGHFANPDDSGVYKKQETKISAHLKWIRERTTVPQGKLEIQRTVSSKGKVEVTPHLLIRGDNKKKKMTTSAVES